MGCHDDVRKLHQRIVGPAGFLEPLDLPDDIRDAGFREQVEDVAAAFLENPEDIAGLDGLPGRQWEQGRKDAIFLGVLGPILVLYHSNFGLGSFNSQVALYCMLLVAASGVIGRHLYARIQNGLYGGKASLEDLRNDLNRSLQNNHGLATLLPRFAAKLEALAAEAQGCSITGSLSVRASLAWSLKKYVMWISLSRAAHRELGARAAAYPAVARDIHRLKKACSIYIRNFVHLTTRVAQYTLFERISSLWHVLHMPLFFMMVISALVHVLAVHMY